MSQYWFVPTKYRRSSNLALFTFVFAFVVILLGAYTRLTDAGLSCPDWPHCYGYMTAPHTSSQLETAMQNYPATPVNITKAWTEMTHRYFAGTEGLLILILSLSILLARRAKDLKSVFISIALIGLVIVQILLGMLTVTEKLKPVIVLSHLLTGITILSMLWWAYLDLNMREGFFDHSNIRIKPWLWLGFIILAGQITLGGWVSTHYAGLACIDFPYCNGQILPTLQWNSLNTDLITIHMLHRIGAMITASYLIMLAFFLSFKPAFRSYAILIFALVALQVVLGILNIVWLRPVWIALIHQAVAIILLMTLITSIVKVSLTKAKQYGSWIA